MTRLPINSRNHSPRSNLRGVVSKSMIKTILGFLVLPTSSMCLDSNKVIRPRLALVSPLSRTNIHDVAFLGVCGTYLPSSTSILFLQALS